MDDYRAHGRAPDLPLCNFKGGVRPEVSDHASAMRVSSVDDEADMGPV